MFYSKNVLAFLIMAFLINITVLLHNAGNALDGFTDPANWEAYDAGFTGDTHTKDYFGAYFDGRYVYFLPFADSQTRHARVLPFDTTKAFNN